MFKCLTLGHFCVYIIFKLWDSAGKGKEILSVDYCVCRR